MTVSQLREYAEKGMSLRQAAAIINTPISTLGDRAKLFNIKFQHYTLLWQHRIEAEFEMPVKELILAFIRDRYSKRLTAATIGISNDTLDRYCRRENLIFPSRRELREECKPKRSTGKGVQ
jgi:hypothetical protein